MHPEPTDPSPPQPGGNGSRPPRRAGVLEPVVAEVERHVAAGGWDQPTRLYALVETADLVAREPALARDLGLVAAAPGALTPIEQDDVPQGPLDDVLAGIAWPEEVLGCAVVTEAVVLPPGAEQAAPPGLDAADLDAWAVAHPQRRDVRFAVAVLRDGSHAARLRVRGDSSPLADEVADDPDVAPNLVEALLATLG